MSGVCLWGSCAGSTWFVADLIARGNSWRRRMTSWDGWTFARIHWAYLPMPSGWLSRNSVVWLSHSAWNFRSICSIYIYSVYTHTYCTHLYGIYICTHMCMYLILELKPMGLGFWFFGHAHQFDGSIPGNSLLISGAVLGEILPNFQGPWLMIRPGPIPGETIFFVARNRLSVVPVIRWGLL